MSFLTFFFREKSFRSKKKKKIKIAENSIIDKTNLRCKNIIKYKLKHIKGEKESMKKRFLKKFFVFLLAFVIVYVNGAITINAITNGIVSYATNGIENLVNNGLNTQGDSTQEEETTRVEIEQDEICKTDMQDTAYQYLQNIKIDLTDLTSKKINISETANIFYKSEIEATEEIENFYKTTKISKTELINVLGETGTIEIVNKENSLLLLNMTKAKIEETSELEEGAIIETVKSQEEGQEETIIANVKNYVDYIEIEYVGAVKNIEITIIGSEETGTIEKTMNILNTKEIGIIESTLLSQITKMKTTITYKEFENEADETAALEEIIEKEIAIKERQTKAEIEIDKKEISTTIENDVQFTINLNTENKMYDLYKNPTFTIQLPSSVETINQISLEEISILNNKRTDDLEQEENIFTDINISQTEENNIHYIQLSMQGEQTQYSNEEIKNVQITIPAKIRISNLLPNMEDQIILNYTNENATTYNSESYGEDIEEIQIVATTGIITKTIITVGEDTIENYKEETNSLTIGSKENNQGTVKVIIVNNTGTDLENVALLGKSQGLSKITLKTEEVAEASEEPIITEEISYSTEENITIDSAEWSTEYIAEAKRYLIELQEMAQGETIEYSYNIDLPEVEEDTTYEEAYTLFNGTEEILTRTNEINLKTVKLEVNLETSVGENKIYAGQEFSYIITVKNLGGTVAKNISITNTLPNNITLVNTEDSTSWTNINLEPAETITKNIRVKADEVEEETTIENIVEVNADYLEDTIIKTIEKMITKSEIKAELRTEISKYSELQENVEIGSNIEYNIYLQNNSTELKNINITAELPECLDEETIEAKIYRYDETTTFWEPEEVELNLKGEEIVISLQLPANEERIIVISGVVDKYIEKEVTGTILIKYDEEEMVLQDTKIALTPAQIEISNKTYKNNEEILTEKIDLQKGEELKYQVEIKNTGETEETLELAIEVSELLDVTGVRIETSGNVYEMDEEGLSNNILITGEVVGENTEKTIIIKGTLREDLTITSDIITTLKIRGEYIKEEITIKHTVEVEDNPIIPEDPETPPLPENPEDPERKYSISGVAWLDENKNGAREETETLLKDIQVQLINSNNQVEKETTTDKKGTYKFENLIEGEYILIFEYNKNEYKITTPRKEGVIETLNSDVYTTSTNGQNITKTDKLLLTQNLKNIDIGLINKEIFDLSITKQIRKITVKNAEGTKVIEYKNSDFAKIEIPAKSYLNSNLIIEYDIIVKNEGEVPGYVYTIKDIVPEGTNFISEMNEDWYEEDGDLYSISLSQEEIKPQETKTIAVALTKEIKTDKAETIINKAEIVETFNEQLLQENETNNNTSTAEILVSIKTGQTKTYIMLTITVLTIISVGAYIIQKKVL